MERPKLQLGKQKAGAHPACATDPLNRTPNGVPNSAPQIQI